MKQVFFALILLAFGMSAHAQENEEPCYPPRVISKSVVNFDGFSRVALKFDVETFDVLYRQVGELDTRAYTVTDGVLLLTEVATEIEFELLTATECDENTLVELVSTKRATENSKGIEVSKAFFNALALWQDTEDSPKLYTYIMDHHDLSAEEKASFFQQFYFKGRPFANDAGMFPPPPDEDKCLCNLVLNHTELVAPGTQSGGHITALGGIEAGESSGGEIDWNNDSGYFYERWTSGAAKAHYFRTQGYKAGGTDRVQGNNSATTYPLSPNRGQLMVSYVCDNGKEPDRECECVKDVRLIAEYHDRVIAMANLLGNNNSVWKRNSWAISEDMAVATLRKGNSPEVQVLDAGLIQAAADCETSLNEEFFLKILDVATNVANAILVLDPPGGGTPSSTDLTTLIQNLSDGIAGVITTDPYLSTPCDVVPKEGTLLQVNSTVELAANERLYFDVYSFSNQQVGGKRNWASESHIYSSFYMVAVASGHAEEPRECCENTLATWILADEGGPYNDNSLKQFVGSELTASGGSAEVPWRFKGQIPMQQSDNGAINIPAEYGWADLKADCGGKPEEPIRVIQGVKTTGRTEMNSGNIQPTGPDQVYVYDVSGKLIYSGSDYLEKGMVESFFYDKNINTVPGLYFVQIVHDNKPQTVKVLVNK